MSGSEEALPESLELALSHVTHARGEALAAHIRPILLENFKRKRVSDLPGYVYRVADKYDALSGYVHDLQVVRSEQVWAPLVEKLQRWAWRFLWRHHVDREARARYSYDYADQAAAELMTAYFPYDVEFDSWARRSLHFVCLTRLADLRRSKWYQLEVSLKWEERDEWVVGKSIWTDWDLETNFEERQAVQGALRRLPRALGLVIWLHYYEGLSFAQISNVLRVPVGAVYKRHHDAKGRLALLLRE